MSERWLPVPGYEGAYEVSDLGRVRSLDRVVPYSDGRIAHVRGKILTGSTGAKRYPLICLPGGVRKYLHDLVSMTFIGPKPEGSEVCHKDDNAKNNAPSNLYYGDRFTNATDKTLNGGQTFASAHHNTVYDEETIAEAMRLRGFVSSRVASEITGVKSSRYIREIWAGEARVRG